MSNAVRACGTTSCRFRDSFGREITEETGYELRGAVSAYYEYLCKRAGIEVHYCAEQFENDGGPTSTIIKSVKRAMAGEYSRELSSKVFKGQCRLIELGYRQGGMAGFGLRRMLINQAGESKGTLTRGEQKSLQTDRVILVPGPDDEVRIVQWISKFKKLAGAQGWSFITN